MCLLLGSQLAPPLLSAAVEPVATSEPCEAISGIEVASLVQHTRMDCIWWPDCNSLAAPIVDRSQAHWTSAIRDAAAAMNLPVIQVPGGCMAELQPLDARFNGPLLMKRKQFWAANKLLHPSPSILPNGAQPAYATLLKSLALAGFRGTWYFD